jgi:DNA-binding HxlR family transcriptional regulator
MDPQLLEALRALADASRLRLVGLLSARPMAVEELAAASGLSAGTVVHHLKRLEAAGLVESTPRRPYVEYALRLDRLQTVSKQLAGLENAGEAGDRLAGPDGESLPAYDAKVLRAFLRDGRLVSIPAQERKRQAVLRYLAARCFAEDRTYSEREVNERLSVYHDDVAALRRYLVVAGLMTRAGGEYHCVGSMARREVGGEPAARCTGGPASRGRLCPTRLKP